jgi:hypothetical protein
MTERKKRTIAGDKTICLPMAAEIDYDKLVEDPKAFRAYLDKLMAMHPELFPVGIEQGYCFDGFVESGKLHLNGFRTSRQLATEFAHCFVVKWTWQW